jgi:branched-subunit amino acid ABC-type transport system permease component
VRSLLPFLVVGITTGSLYGLAGVGLVLTYRTSGVFNFAHGAIAAAAAYLFYRFHFAGPLPWPVAFLASVLIVGVGGGIAVERLARRLAGGRAASVIVATVGLLLAVQGLLYLRFGVLTRAVPSFLPSRGIVVSGVAVSYAQMITVAVAVAAVAALSWFLRATRLGITMRAVVDGPELLSLTGTSPARVRTLSWVIGCSFAALSGVLVAPITGLDAVLLTLLVVQAFGAVAVGRFTSLPLTFAGGLGIGILASIATKYVTNNVSLSGLPSAVPFITLIAMLLLSPRKTLPRDVGRVGGFVTTCTRRSTPPALGLLALLAAAALPHVVGQRLPVYLNGMTLAVVFLSLSLLVRASGQISLCHGAFMALGATTFAHLAGEARLPWLLALLGAGVVAVPLGALVAVPAIRLSGVYLALATFGFGIVVQNVLYNTPLMFGHHASLTAPRPQLGFLDGSNDTHFYYVGLGVALGAGALVVVVARTKLGRLLRAMSESPTALATNGLSVNVTRVFVFCLSAFLAGVAGGLFVSQATTVSRESAFGPFQSLTWVALLVICGRGVVTPSLLAAGALAVAPSYVAGLTFEWQLILFGAAAIAATVLIESPPTWNWIRRQAARSEWRHARSPVRSRMTPRLVSARTP